MAEKNQSGPKNADQRQDQKPIATKPMHARIIPLLRDFEISFSGIGAAVKSSGRIDLEINKFCLTRKFQSLTKTPNFDQFPPFEISSAVPSVFMRSSSDSRRSANARPGTARLGSKPRGVARQAGLSWSKRHTQCRN